MSKKIKNAIVKSLCLGLMISAFILPFGGDLVGGEIVNSNIVEVAKDLIGGGLV